MSNLSFSYKKEPTLKNITFDVFENDFIGIVGPNGGGKSTLVKILVGLITSYEGKIAVLGNSPLSDPHHVAYLAQQLQFDSQIPITVEEVVLMGCLGHQRFGFYSKKDKVKARNAMKKMDVENLKDHFFADLSGGQRQRVLIARALTCNPKILILDEPTTGIDFHHEAVLYELLRELNKTMAILLVSHEYNLVSNLVDRVLCINVEGHIHYPAQITKESFLKLVSAKYQLVEHNHEEHSHE